MGPQARQEYLAQMRVRACAQADPVKVAALERQRDRLDPFTLAARIDAQLTQVYALANHQRGPVPSTVGGAGAGAKNAPAPAPLPLQNAPSSVTPVMARRYVAR